MKREVSVRLSKRALQDVLDLDLWWRRHHPSKPNQFDEELTATIALLRQFPEVAPRALTKSYKNARVRVLVETGHLVVVPLRRSHGEHPAHLRSQSERPTPLS